MNIAGGGALLDDFLEGTRFIPVIFQRTSLLLREVDAKQTRDLFLLKRAQEAHLEHVVVKRSKLDSGGSAEADDDVEAAAELAKRVQHIRQRLEVRSREKRVLSQQLVDLCKTNLDKLTANCAYLEAELKRLGELEDEPEVHHHHHASSSSFSASAAGSSSSSSMLYLPTHQQQQQQSGSASPVAGSAQSPPPSTLPLPSAAAALTASTTPQQQMVAANSEDDSWILAKLVEERASTVLVADADNDQTRFELPKSKVVYLPPHNSTTTNNQTEDVPAAKQRLPKGRTVLALYPETTSFYPAIVAQAAYMHAGRVHVACVFADDEDEVTNIAPKRAVPAQFVFVL